MTLRWLLAALLLCVHAAGAWAQEAQPPAGLPGVITLAADGVPTSLRARSAFWLDAHGTATIDTVATLPDTAYSTYEASTPLVIEGQVLWIRFDLSVLDERRHWLLDVELPGVDRVTLYYRQDGQWVSQSAGDTLPISQWTQAGRKPALLLGHGGPVRYWLAVEHRRVPFSGELTLAPQDHLAAANERSQFYLGAYFGLAALAVMMAVANALVYRDKGFATYAVYVLMMALAQAAFTGVGHLYLWPSQAWLSNPATFCMPMLAGATGVWFVRTVTSPRQFSVMLDRMVVGFVSVLCVVAVFDAAVPTVTGFAINNTLLLTSMVLTLALIGLSVTKGDRHGRWVALGFAPVVLGATFPLMRNWGLINSGFLTEYGVMVGSALEMPLLFYGLHRRLTELTEARARARALSITDPLTGLALGRVLRLRLHDAILRFRRHRQQGALMMIDLVNHAAISEEYGPEMGDRALVLAASRLRGIARDVDTAARMGANRFALLVEGPLSHFEASAMATQVIARGLRESELLPPQVALRFHVAVAMIPDAQMNFGDSQDAYIDWTADAVADLAGEPSRSIRHLNF